MTYKFTCVVYPHYRVLVRRGGGTEKWAEFRQGGLETADEEIAEKLRQTLFVHEDTQIDLDNAAVIVDRQGEEILTTAKRVRKARGG